MNWLQLVEINGVINLLELRDRVWAKHRPELPLCIFVHKQTGQAVATAAVARPTLARERCSMAAASGSATWLAIEISAISI